MSDVTTHQVTSVVAERHNGLADPPQLVRLCLVIHPAAVVSRQRTLKTKTRREVPGPDTDMRSTKSFQNTNKTLNICTVFAFNNKNNNKELAIPHQSNIEICFQY